MNRLTDELKSQFDELGIPESVATLSPETCTCGVDGCNQHDTWGNRLVDGIFRDWEGPIPSFDLDIEFLNR